MSWILYFLYLCIFLFILSKHRFFKSLDLTTWQLAGIFLLKVLGSFAVYFVYTHIYQDRSTSDIFTYYDDGLVLFSALQENPLDYFRMLTGIGGDAPHLMKYYNTCNFWIKPFDYGLFNDTKTVIRFNALVSLISYGNYHTHALLAVFMSFTGLTGILKTLRRFSELPLYPLIGLVYFLPSVFFWTSGIFKESILLFAFGLFLWFVSKWALKEFKIINLLYMVLLFALLLVSKFYVLVAAIPGFLYLFTASRFKQRQVLQFVGGHLLLIVFVFSTSLFLEKDFVDIVVQKQQDFLRLVESLGNVGSKIALTPLEQSVWSFLKNTPQAIFNSLLRPFIWEKGSVTQLMAGLENLLILLLLLFMVVFFNRKAKFTPIVGFSLSFVLILFTLSGLTTPVLGALVRYKMPALPFLLVLLVHYTNWKRVGEVTKVN